MENPSPTLNFEESGFQQLREGDVVRVMGLAASSQYNGQRGEVCVEVEVRGRLGVRLIDEPYLGKLLSCRPQNLVLLTRTMSPLEHEDEHEEGEGLEVKDVEESTVCDNEAEDCNKEEDEVEDKDEEEVKEASLQTPSPLEQDEEERVQEVEKEEQEQEVALPSLAELGSSFDNLVQQISGMSLALSSGGRDSSVLEQQQEWEAEEEVRRREAFSSLHERSFCAVNEDLHQRMVRLAQEKPMLQGRRSKNNTVKNRSNSKYTSRQRLTYSQREEEDVEEEKEEKDCHHDDDDYGGGGDDDDEEEEEEKKEAPVFEYDDPSTTIESNRENKSFWSGLFSCASDQQLAVDK